VPWAADADADAPASATSPTTIGRLTQPIHFIAAPLSLVSYISS
jgi:hypothetical protein